MKTIELVRLLSRVQDFRVDLTWFTLLRGDEATREELQALILELDEGAARLEGQIGGLAVRKDDLDDTLLALEAAILSAAVERSAIQSDMDPLQVQRLARAVAGCLNGACARLSAAGRTVTKAGRAPASRPAAPRSTKAES